MLADLFWDVATSDWALAALALIVLAAFAVAPLTGLVRRFWPSAYAYDKSAGLINVLAAALLFFLVGFRVSDERAEAARLRVDLAGREAELQQLQSTADDAEVLKRRAEEAATKAQGELDDYRKTYADNVQAACAFTADDIERLRKLTRAPAAGLRQPSALDECERLASDVADPLEDGRLSAGGNPKRGVGEYRVALGAARQNLIATRECQQRQRKRLGGAE
ncbi:hypothetical protein JQ625_06845 [Bradyrhizobium diazoefficiens]|nr:hypothetical protein [Bradyrhizobium diazoefficiens]MBR0774544.1 hypothetical protein [Bradyrhizobium diazoefficiens]